jgi:hypothetical protein
MISRRKVLSSGALLAFGAIAWSCKEKTNESASTSSASQTTAKSGPLEPTEPVDPAFRGCSKSCGSRSAKDRQEAKAQPGAQPGDATFCPVSGAVFRITSQTPKRDARGKTLWFCCDSCAAFFSSHEADVLEKRGIV